MQTTWINIRKEGIEEGKIGVLRFDERQVWNTDPK